MDFQQVALEYKRLKHLYQTHQVSADVFEKQVNSMVVLHQGQRWMIGVRSGKWYRHEVDHWVEDTPPMRLEPDTPSTQVQAPTKASSENIIPPTQESAAEVPRREGKKETARGWLLGLFFLVILFIVAIGIIAALVLAGIIEPPAQIAAFLSVSTPTAVPSSTPIPTKTDTPSPTSTQAALPLILKTELIGNWTRRTGEAEYRFYPDSTFVYFDPSANQYKGGDYTLMPGNFIILKAILGNQVIETSQYELIFQDEDSMSLNDPEGSGTTWNRSGPPHSSSRYTDPVGLLYELAYRLDWDLPDPNCGFNSSDEETEFHFVCLKREEGLSLTWVDQVYSSSSERIVERNQLTFSIEHQSQQTYADEWSYVETQMKPAEPFHGMPAFSSTVDMDWFMIENFAWQDGEWLYRLLRISCDGSPNTPPEIWFTAETILEIQQGNPPQSSPVTIPTERPQTDYPFSQEIIGTWNLRHPTTETLVFAKDGTINVVSELGQYEYNGIYYFTSENRITFELDSGTVKAGIKMEDDVMTLNINGVESIYDRIE